MLEVLKVMIVEDNSTDQDLIKRQVLKYNSKSLFTVADNRETFIDKINWFLPDLILADYNLPDFTGLDALVYVKENKPFIPFVFVTGGLRANSPVSKVVLDLADGYLLKDNLMSLHTRIGEIMSEMEEKIKMEASQHNKTIAKKINILKAIEILQQSQSFVGKDDIVTLLQQIDEEPK